MATALERAQAIFDAGTLPTFTTSAGHTIEMLQSPQRVANGKGVAFWLRVTTAEGEVVPISNPVVLVNPPTMVPDGAGGFQRDVREAVRRALRDAVFTVVAQRAQA